jgi:hypothetical protein
MYIYNIYIVYITSKWGLEINKQMKNAGTTRPWKTVHLPSLSCHKHFAAVPILQVPGAKKLAAGFPQVAMAIGPIGEVPGWFLTQSPINLLISYQIGGFLILPVSTVEPKVTCVGGLRCTHHK